MTLQVDVYHNDTHPFEEYRDGDSLRLVHSFNWDPVDVPVQDLRDLVFDICNMDADWATPGSWLSRQVQEYRAGRNRSLSVGDVVSFDGLYWSVAAFGFKEITRP